MLTEILQEKNINLAKLSELTGVSERYLKALLEENYEKMPAAPYARSYLFKIADALNLDGEKLWQDYQKNAQLKKSGGSDQLPVNRFRPRPLNKTLILLFLLIVLIAIYLIFRYNFFLGKPTVSLLGQLSSSVNPTVYEPDLKIEGEMKAGNQLTINKEEIFVDNNGYFQKDFSLQPGLNVIQLRAKKFLGRETTITKQVLYLPNGTSTKNGQNQ